MSSRSKARANDSRNPLVLNGCHPAVASIAAAESLEKKAAKELAATMKVAKELAATLKVAKDIAAAKRKKKDPPAKSSIKSSNVSSSPLKDKSNEHHDSNVYPTTVVAEIGTKQQSVRSIDPKIAKLIGTLKQTAKEKDETIIKLEQESVDLQRKNAKLIKALIKANTTVEEREAIIIKQEQELVATQRRHAPSSTPGGSPWGDTSNNPPTPIFVPTPKVWVGVGNPIKLQIAPTRTVSTVADDSARENLGANGYMNFETNQTPLDSIDLKTGARVSLEPGDVRRVLYYSANHVLMFMAELPKRKLLKDIQGNAGADFMFAWDVVNEVHGYHRRYVFAFPSKTLLSVALYRIFYDNQQLMEEFFIVNGRNRFYAKEANVPAHKVLTTEFDMDIERPKTHRPGYTSKQYQMELGIQYNVFDETQRY